MSATNVEAKVKSIISEQLGVKEEEIKINSSFIEDLGADSLDTPGDSPQGESVDSPLQSADDSPAGAAPTRPGSRKPSRSASTRRAARSSGPALRRRSPATTARPRRKRLPSSSST